MDFKRSWRLMMVLASLGISDALFALDTLDDKELSAVSGADGISVFLGPDTSGKLMSAQNVRWENDIENSAGMGIDAKDVSVSQLSSAAYENAVEMKIDVGSTDSGDPVLATQIKWNPVMLTIDEVRTRSPSGSLSTSSAGRFAIQSSGEIVIINEGGLFNAASDNAYVKIKLGDTSLEDYSNLFIRRGGAGAPEFSFGNANFLMETESCGTLICKLGIDANGLFLSSDQLNYELNYELLFKNAPTSPNGYDTTGREEMIAMGWSGRLENFDLRIGQGAILGSEGIGISTSFDFSPDFSFTLGQAGGDGTTARFYQFQGLPSGDAKHYSMPIEIDTVPAGTNHFGDLCFGGAPTCSAGTPVPQLWVNNPALAVRIRDAHLNAFNRKVEIIDKGAGTSETYDWSLGYVFGRLDSNIAVYPGLSFGDGPLSNVGMTLDVSLVINSPGFWNRLQNNGPGAGENWARNSHFFLADTATNYAFGLFNADVKWVANNLGLRVAGDGDVSYGLAFGGGLRLQSSQGVQYQFRGLLAGANVQDFSNLVSIAITDVNIDTSQFVFSLTPGPNRNGTSSVGFEGLLDLKPSSYFSFAEPSSASAEIAFRDVSGRLLWRDGFIQIASGNKLPNGKAALLIENSIHVGMTAQGEPFRGSYALAGKEVMDLAIPTGIFHSAIQVGPQ